MAKKIEITDEQLIQALEIFDMRKDIANHFNISTSYLYERYKKLGLIHHQKHEINIPHDEFIKLYMQNINDSEIGRILNIDHRRIQEYRTKLNLKSNLEKDLSFTNEQYQIFLGGMYGDSYMGVPNDCKNAYFTFKHSLAQEQYCLWKYEKLKNLCFNPCYSSQYDKRTNKTYNGITITSYTNKLFTPYLEKFYHIDEKSRKKTKYINKELIKDIDALGLAILFQDDGAKTSSSYSIATCNFNEEDWQILHNCLYYKFNIDTNRHADYTTYIKACDKNTFRDLILPYIHDNCKYKIHT